MTFTYEPGLITYVIDGEVMAKIAFPANEDGTVWDITHTVVHSSLRGQGIANALLEEVVQLAIEADVKLKPTCVFAEKVFARTPAYQALQVTE